MTKPVDIERAIELAGGDNRFFIESYFNIVNKDSKVVPFVFNTVQDDYWKNRLGSGIVLKARKMGFTSLEVADSTASIATKENQRCVLVSHEKESTKRILKKAHDYLDTCGLDTRHIKRTDTGLYNPILKSSLWIGTAGAKAFGRGDDITKYHLTEYAFWDNSDLITGIEEACVNNAHGCIESTANGWGTEFHRIWQRAESGGVSNAEADPYELDMDSEERKKHFYRPHFYPWMSDPTYSIALEHPLESLNAYEKELKDRYGTKDPQLAWRRRKIAGMSNPDKFPQEYPATPEEAFLVSGSMVFDSYALRSMRESRRPLQWRGEIVERSARVSLDQNSQGRFRIYVPPRDGKAYIVSADIAIGTEGGNYSVADVWDVETWEQVAQFHGHIAPDDFGDTLMLMGAFYNWAFLAPEVNNHGLTTCIRIRDAEYPKLLTRDKDIGGTDLGWYTSPGESGTRSELINNYGKAIRTFSCKLNSPLSIHEAMAFVRLKNGKLGAQGSDSKIDGKKTHDDTVFSGGIGLTMLEANVQAPEFGYEGMSTPMGVVGRRPKRFGPRVTRPKKGGY